MHHRDIRSAKFVNDLESGVTENSDHHLRINLIFGTAEGNDRGTTGECDRTIERTRLIDVDRYRRTTGTLSIVDGEDR